MAAVTVRERQIRCDITYIGDLKKPKSLKQRVQWWLPGAEGERNGEMSINEYKVKVAQSCLTLCHLMDYTVDGILQARILDWVASSLLQGIFPTQGLNSGLPHCRQILNHLSHQGSPSMNINFQLKDE